MAGQRENMLSVVQVLMPVYNMEKYFSSVVRRCKGLSLTAKLLGGLLESKTNVDEWRKILNNNIWICVMIEDGVALLWMAEGSLLAYGGNKKMKIAGYRLFLANMSDEEIGDFLRRFQRLRVLSLLRGGKLPNSISNFKQLWYLNLSGSSEHRLPETLRNLQILILRGQNGSSIKELGELKCLEGKLRIWMFQKVDDAQDALGANLEGMRDLKKFDLRWSDDAYGSLDERMFHQLKSHVNVVSSMEIALPQAFHSISLESLTFERMLQWCEWIPDVAKSDRDKSFPCLQFVLSLPRPTTIKKMSLRDTSNDHPDHMVKLEKLNYGWQSLTVQSCNSDSLLEEMEQRSYFLTIQEMSIHCSSLRCFPVKHFPKLKQLDITGCSNLESLCLLDGAGEWSNLEDLSLFDCSNLKSVDCSLPSLSLTIHDCQKLFARLKDLDFDGFFLYVVKCVE
uniref:R13L1/DRL21-like LRR repeat region domain-containing protein n=1 Tax=Salix viminalis TaxID=40686 RepID=A0A6N2NDN9_SALVM